MFGGNRTKARTVESRKFNSRMFNSLKVQSSVVDILDEWAYNKDSTAENKDITSQLVTQYRFNSFLVTGLFLYYLKTSENYRFYNVIKGLQARN